MQERGPEPETGMHLDTLRHLALEFLDLPLDSGKVLYFFPGDLTVLEGDATLGRALRDLAAAGTREERQALQSSYPEGYLTALLESLERLRRAGTLGRNVSPPPVEGLELARIVAANTLRCNMACTYCYNQFASNADTIGPDMTAETLGHVATFLRRHRGERAFQSLLFIGGETLLAFDRVRQAVQYRDACLQEGRDLFLALTTNGTLLKPDVLEFCSRYGIQVKVTLDGDRALHDRCRRFPDGRGSYATISTLLPALFHSYASPSKFVTTTVDTIRDDPARLVQLFAGMGFNQVQLTEKYFEGGKPAVEGLDAESEYRRIYRDMADFLYHRICSRLFLAVLPASDILKKLSRRLPSFFPCDAGVEGLGVGTDGILYPCHHFYGNQDYSVGNVRDETVDCGKLAPYRIPVTRRESCARCWGRTLCGGPCYHRSLAENGDTQRPVEWDCQRRLALYEEMIRLHHRLSVDDPGALAWYLQECARH